MAGEAVSPKDVAAQADRLRRYARALVGSSADADDLVQDCVERALVRLDSIRDPSRLFAWLLAILHNLHAGALRGRRPAVPLDDLADTLALAAPPGDRTAWRDFVRAFGTLPEEHRQVLLLNGLEGLSYREIAEVLEVPIGTVMSRLARARERLRIQLEGGDQQVVRRIR